MMIEKERNTKMKSEVIDAIRMLAKEKEISEETLFKTIEEALKAAYRKNLPKTETAPNNLDVTVNRQDGSISVYARKLILEDEEIEDPTNQISLKEAQKINSSYQMGDIAEVDVTPNACLSLLRIQRDRKDFLRQDTCQSRKL